MNPTRLEELIQRYIDARLTASERAELERTLLQSADARQTFWAHLRFDGAIQETVETVQARQWMTDAERGAGRPPTAIGPWKWWVALAAGIAVLLAWAWSPRTPLRVEETSGGVAIFSGAVDVRWAPDQPALEPGSILGRGAVRIESGLIGIEFYGGARMALQGPADVDLRQVNEVFCRAGKIRVHVPERAQGFRVLSPRLEMIDLGTEFGVDVSPEGGTELHVFNGKVEVADVEPSAAPRAVRELVTGEGLRVDEKGMASIPAQPSRFAGPGELNLRVLEQTRSRLAAWQEASRAVQSDPRLILYYDFAPAGPGERVLANRAQSTGRTLDGTLVGASWTQGRWEGKTALEFREAGDRVRIFVPGEYEAMTLIAWVRVDSFDTMYSGLLLTDGFAKGAVHWQFCHGRLRLGLAGDRNARGRIGTEYDVDSIEPAALLGRWRQLAVVIDNHRREVVHYIDGRPVKRDTIARPNRLLLGKAELGNWGLPDNSGSAPVRNFNGRMDEFMLFNEALTDAEIAGLYEQGRPWPGTIAGLQR